MVRTVRLPACPSRVVAVVSGRNGHNAKTYPIGRAVGGRLTASPPLPAASVTSSAGPDRNALAEIRFSSQPINVNIIMSHKMTTSSGRFLKLGSRPQPGDWHVTHS